MEKLLLLMPVARKEVMEALLDHNRFQTNKAFSKRLHIKLIPFHPSVAYCDGGY